MRYTILASVVAVLGLATASFGAEPLKSGIQAGEKIISIFEPLNVTGEFAGQPHCLVCENGVNPVAMVFAREPSEAVWKLVAQLDRATAKHKDQSMGSFVVFLSDQEGLDKRLKEAAKQQRLAHIVLAIDSPAGPEGFKVADAAAVTVVLYSDFEVKANRAFRSGELSDLAIEQIAADVNKIVPAK